jgi:predicted MPP superfamily phosphohydrolase
MTLFLLTFFILYAGVHVYAFLKARAALSFGAGTTIFLMVFMTAMIAAPFVVRLSERAGLESFARVAAYIGYTWIGVLFLFFSYSLAFDALRLISRTIGVLFRKDLSAFSLSAGYSFSLPLVLSLITSAYGSFEARDVRTERLTIKTSKIPPEAGRLKIVQISDVHLGLIVREGRLRKIIEVVRKEDPDILVSTGDLVDGEICNLNGLSDLIKEIKPRYGKFAITGNHEFYAGLDQAECFTKNAGFTLLREEGLTVADLINIAGVDDPAKRRYGLDKDITEKELLSSLPRDKFTLLLKHRPRIDKEAVGLFDLQLSGHAHKGQIFPFSLLTWLVYPVHAGVAELPGDSRLYVSRGSGTWGPPIRFLAPPEVTAVDLIPHSGHLN